MEHELKEIKERRKKLGLTQTQLAKKSGVSQSLIAKVEAGTLDPTYSNARKIFSAIEAMSKKDESKAEEFMNKKVISVTPETFISDAVKEMRKHEISQIPIIDNGKAVGYLSEAEMMDALIEGKKSSKAKEAMRENPPCVEPKTLMVAVSSLLRDYPLVLVIDKEKIVGIITKSDVIRKLSETSRFHIFG